MKETTICFGPQENLVGTLVTPDTVNGRPAIVFLNAGFTPRIGPNRLFVRLARFFGELGYPSLRFDFSGLGDSTRGSGAGNEAAEVRLAMDELQKKTGCRSILLFGLCSGTDHCLSVGPTDPRVVGMLLLDPFTYPNWRSNLVVRWRRFRDRLHDEVVGRWRRIHQHLRQGTLMTKIRGRARGNANPEASDGRWVAEEQIWNELRPKPSREEFARRLAAVLEHNKRILVIYTNSVADEHNYQGQFGHVHPELRRFRSISSVLLAETDHTYSHLFMQEQLARTLRDWLERNSESGWTSA
jgi:pimeloyl-ACP methyl ester carboxylesterase